MSRKWDKKNKRRKNDISLPLEQYEEHPSSRPGVFAFRNTFVGAQRHRETALGVALIVALGAVGPSLLLQSSPDWFGAEESDLLVTAVFMLVFAWLFLLLLLLGLNVPNTILRIGPKGIRWSRTRWGCFTRTGHRWSLHWCDIARIKWNGSRTTFVDRKTGRKRMITSPANTKRPYTAIKEALELYLSGYFDLSKGTYLEQIRNQTRGWSWKRKFLDKVELVLVACGFMGWYGAIFVYALGYVFLPTLWLLTGAFTIRHFIRYHRFIWQEPVALQHERRPVML